MGGCYIRNSIIIPKRNREIVMLKIPIFCRDSSSPRDLRRAKKRPFLFGNLKRALFMRTLTLASRCAIFCHIGRPRKNIPYRGPLPGIQSPKKQDFAHVKKNAAQKVEADDNKNVHEMLGRNPMPIPSHEPRTRPKPRAKDAPTTKAAPRAKRRKSDTSS